MGHFGRQTSIEPVDLSPKRPRRASFTHAANDDLKQLHVASSVVERDDRRPRVAATLVDLLRANASLGGDRPAFHWVRDDEKDDVALTYRELHHQAMAIAAELQASDAQGRCALLLFPPGLDFIAAFFGCLYAGVVAVPVALPARNRSTSSVETILHASDPALILSTATHREQAEQLYAQLPTLLKRRWLATDAIPDDRRFAWCDPKTDAHQTAFLQYTSGSTSSPKGVSVSHENLMRNSALIQRAFGNRPDGKGVSWLPLHHDMGLIGGVVQPVYCGAECILMAPAAFLQRPALWLETISRTGAAVSGGPDFAYDLCVRKIPASACQNLDLSNWKVAFTGAERIRAETIERFSEAFAPCGFRREAFFPCYGLAEATLMVSGGPRQTPPTMIRLRSDALERHQVADAPASDSTARVLVGCGEGMPGQKIAIVDPQTRLPCAAGRIGEIWVRGPSIAGGYHGQAETSQKVFGARLSHNGKGPFLRTGDLGFLRDGQLFMTGRLKDVIIIRGRNYYPEDIEHSATHAHADFRVGYCAAFSVDIDDRERLAVIQEIEPRRRNLDADAALRAIRGAVASRHELEASIIVLAKAGEIPKTSSGKTRRAACRERYLAGQLEIIAEWKANGDVLDEKDGNGVAAPLPTDGSAAKVATAAEIEEWLIARIAARLSLPPAQIQVKTPFLEYGMSSLDAVEITAELERWLGRRISPTAIYNYPNIAALTQWLSQPLPAEEPSATQSLTSASAGELRPEQLFEEVLQMTEAEAEALIQQEMAKQ